MKSNIYLLTTAFLISGMIFSCKKISELNTTIVQVNLEESANIKSDTIGFSKEVVLDANSNLDYSTRKSKLLEVTIEGNKIRYQVANIAQGSSDSLENLKFELLNPSTNQFEELASDSNKVFTNGSAYELAISPSSLSKLVEIFQSSNPKVTFSCRGKMKGKPIDFKISAKVLLSLKTKI